MLSGFASSVWPNCLSPKFAFKSAQFGRIVVFGQRQKQTYFVLELRVLLFGHFLWFLLLSVFFIPFNWKRIIANRRYSHQQFLRHFTKKHWYNQCFSIIFYAFEYFDTLTWNCISTISFSFFIAWWEFSNELNNSKLINLFLA